MARRSTSIEPQGPPKADRCGEKFDDLGDFQTPPGLAFECCRLLRALGFDPGTVLEPTCGRGAFLEAAAEVFPKARLRGWELQEEYVREARSRLGRRARIERGDFFGTDWNAVLAGVRGDVLIVGNPPWVTNAAIGREGGANLPAKRAPSGWSGVEAITGRANFDISEWMIVRLLEGLGVRGGD